MTSDPRIERGMSAQMELRHNKLGAGERHLGWKVGFGSKAAMEQLGTDVALVGFLTDRTLISSGSEVAIGDWAKPMLEPEIAIRIGRDVEGAVDPASAGEAIAGLGPAIEIADLDPPPDDPERILAGNIFHRGVVLGPVTEARAGGSTDGISTRVRRNGEEIAAADDPEALTGSLPAVVANVAAVLAEAGEQLRAGDVIIAGSMTAPQPVAPGEVVRVETTPWEPLELRFSE